VQVSVLQDGLHGFRYLAYLCVPGKVRVEQVGCIVRVMFHHLLDLDHPSWWLFRMITEREIIFHRGDEIAIAMENPPSPVCTKHRAPGICNFAAIARVSQIPWWQGSLTSQTAAVSSGSSAKPHWFSPTSSEIRHGRDHFRQHLHDEWSLNGHGAAVPLQHRAAGPFFFY